MLETTGMNMIDLTKRGRKNTSKTIAKENYRNHHDVCRYVMLLSGSFS